MILRGIKIKLHPNNKQNTRMFQYAGAARFAYNWALEQENQAYETGNPFVNERGLRRRFTRLKKLPEHAWLNGISNNVTKQAIKDAVGAYQRFFKGLGRKPRFKSKYHSVPAFYQDVMKIKFTDGHVRIEKLMTPRSNGCNKANREKCNYVKLAEKNRVKPGQKVYNPRFTFDGNDWWVSVAVEVPDEDRADTGSAMGMDRGMGIDLGVKDLATCSDGTVYGNINKYRTVKRRERRKRHLQRKLSRKMRMNNPDKMNKKGVRFKRSRNYGKAKKAFARSSRRNTNVLREYVRTCVHEIISKRPRFVVLEDLNVKGMLKNRRLARSIQAQRFGLFRRIMSDGCGIYGIPLVIADRWYPSSKTCHVCGHVKKDLTLKDRTYVCPICGNTMDRDYQAALNLEDYGYRTLMIA